MFFIHGRMDSLEGYIRLRCGVESIAHLLLPTDRWSLDHPRSPIRSPFLAMVRNNGGQGGSRNERLRNK